MVLIKQKKSESEKIFLIYYLLFKFCLFLFLLSALISFKNQAENENLLLQF